LNYLHEQKTISMGPGEAGMTLLEIIFAVTLMMIMTFATASVLRNGLDLRFELSQKARTTHKINVVMQKVSKDIQHAFLIPSTQAFSRRAEIKSLFRIKPWDQSSELRLTTMDHEPLLSSAHEGDQAFVVYRIEKDKNNRPVLYRGESPVVPQNMDEDIPLVSLGSGIKSLKIQAWNGEGWKEEWDSAKSDWRDMMPKMVKIEVTAYSNDPASEEEAYGDNDATTTARTVVYIPRSSNSKEPRDPPKTLKIEGF
jgi:type II secretory pathway pseudopilin PulG